MMEKVCHVSLFLEDVLARWWLHVLSVSDIEREEEEKKRKMEKGARSEKLGARNVDKLGGARKEK